MGVKGKWTLKLLADSLALAPFALGRLLLNLCAYSVTRATLIYLLLDVIEHEAEGSVSKPAILNSQRLFGCHSNTIYGRSQLLDDLHPLVFRRILEILTYLATNHSAVAKLWCYFDQSIIPNSSSYFMIHVNEKGKEKVIEGRPSPKPFGPQTGDVPLVHFFEALELTPIFTQQCSS
ncbi:hypothetical protein VNO77_34653 [Canavalia gladiata]|uniref:Uncharacterized protein n=1 Tax=Canavalia gladiata TaxID=3824 RepID=A0AAN9KHV2_CANGL